MKTVFQKMLSLVLVAVLLVSAVPFQASATSDEYKITVEIYDENEDLMKTGSYYVFTTSKLSWPLSQLLGGDWADNYEVIGYSVGSYFDGSATGDTQFGDYIKENNVVYIEVKAKENAGNGGSTGGSTGGTTGGTTSDRLEKYTLTVNYGDHIDVYAGQLYVDVLASRTPERPGQTFLGWWSDALGRLINKNDQITGSDNVVAKFSDPIQYNLTLDENRKGEEYVNQGKRVTYGEAIGTLYTPTREGYVFMGWKLNGKYITKDTVWTLQGDATAYAQWKLESDTEGEAMGGNGATQDGDVYLEVYIRNSDDKLELDKRIKLAASYSDDDKITYSEIAKVIKSKYTAKSGYSLKITGPFDEEGWWWYTRDEETDPEEYVIVNRDGDDYIYAEVANVKKSTADTSNPKTGDVIMGTVAVMGLSATALAVLFFFNKKKMIG